MDRAAQLVALPSGDSQSVAQAGTHVGAVLSAARGAVVAGRDDDVVFDDDRAEFAAQARTALRDRGGNIEIIVFL